MHTIHFVVNTNVQKACDIFLCYINMLCLIANMFPRHNTSPQSMASNTNKFSHLRHEFREFVLVDGTIPFCYHTLNDSVASNNLGMDSELILAFPCS